MSRKILGESSAVKGLIGMIQRVAPVKTNVLVIGESGTGKELVARMIHESGPLKDKPFIPVNCGAIPETLIESEMFGHKRGSFTGAVSDKAGLFEAANGGTLFLDEVGELPMSMQVKLLRAIQERCFRKVGGTEDIKVDVRIIAATNRDLEAGVAKGTFREDLYYRLNVILIKTPPLKDRKGDVRILAKSFLSVIAAKRGKQIQDFSPEAMKALESYPWPGNVRELENVVERAVTLESEPVIGLAALSPAIAKYANAGQGSTASLPDRNALGVSLPCGAAGSGLHLPSLPTPDLAQGPIQLDEVMAQVERVYIEGALAKAVGSKKKAAELLGVTFRSLRYRLSKLGFEASGGEGGEIDEGGGE